MKPIYRRIRRRSATEAAAPKKDSQQEQSFFGEASQATFFQPAPVINRKCADCDKEEKVHRAADNKEEEKKVMKVPENKEEEKLHKKTNGMDTTSATGINNYVNNLNGKGDPLPTKVNQFFTKKMGYNFSEVRIHTDKSAAESAKALNAQAYAYGNNLVFNEGKFQPDSVAGKHLLAHELTHVLQQNEGIDTAKRKINRQATPPKEQEVNKDLPPQIITSKRKGEKKRDFEKRTDATQKIATDAYHNLDVWFDTYLNLWLTTASVALQQAVVPTDKTQKSNFYKALAGNMLWAATSLFKTWHPAVIAMSVIGAFIGSGGTADDPAPTGVDMVGTRLTQIRDGLAKSTFDVRIDAAIDCSLGNISDLEGQKKILWSKMFPGIAFNNSDQLRAVILDKLNSALAQFYAQWLEWKERIEKCKSDMLIEGKDSGGIPVEAKTETGQQRIFTKRDNEIQRQIIIFIHPDYTAECQRNHPFRPHLSL